jgi:hypothetical protein
MKMKDYIAGYGRIFNARRLKRPTAGRGQSRRSQSPVWRIAVFDYLGVPYDARFCDIHFHVYRNRPVQPLFTGNLLNVGLHLRQRDGRRHSGRLAQSPQ